jgi:hypothetical protein
VPVVSCGAPPEFPNRGRIDSNRQELVNILRPLPLAVALFLTCYGNLDSSTLLKPDLITVFVD